MRHPFPALFLITALLFPVHISAETESELPERYRKWLEEEVVYIIGSIEKEVFLKLQTDRERDLFIEAFWKQRDPNPGTPENEFKQEHYRRINYANHFFARNLPKPGWRTDRGRIYIILGEPRDIMKTESRNEVYSTETWFYQGLTDLGLPTGFHLIFFQKGNTGEFRLYSPAQDGPQALMPQYYGDPSDYLGAYEALREIDASLAEVSLSLITGGAKLSFGRPSLESDMLVQRVETTPTRQLKEIYARKFLEYKDIIDVEYSTNYISSYAQVKLVRAASGLYFVCYAVEPDKLSVSQYQNTFYTNLKLNGTVADEGGKIIYQFEKTIPLKLSPSQMQNLDRTALSIHDMFPLAPGKHRFSLLLQNDVSKEFTSLETSLNIPEPEDVIQMTSLIVGYGVNEQPDFEKRPRPFQVGKHQILVPGNMTFVRKEALAVGFQIHGLDAMQVSEAEVIYSLSSAGKVAKTLNRKVAEYPNLPSLLERIPLEDLPPAGYRLEVTLRIAGNDVISDSEEFEITPWQDLPRPGIHTKSLPPIQDPLYDYVIGNQLFNQGKAGAARDRLEAALHKRPLDAKAALSLAQVLLVLKDYSRMESVLLPFAEESREPSGEIWRLLGISYQFQGKYEQAVSAYEQALLIRGLSTDMLNDLGECFLRMGRRDEALQALERSLELKPDQLEIRSKIAEIKKRDSRRSP